MIALRVHTSRLIGTGPDFVQYGSGKTSVKVRRETLFSEMEDVFHVRGLGRDLEVIKVAGLPGVRLEPPKRLRNLDALSDEDMVDVQRNNLLDSTMPDAAEQDCPDVAR